MLISKLDHTLYSINYGTTSRGGQMGAKEPVVAPPGFLVGRALG